jgi:hypothetical protein
VKEGGISKHVLGMASGLVWAVPHPLILLKRLFLPQHVLLPLQLRRLSALCDGMITDQGCAYNLHGAAKQVTNSVSHAAPATAPSVPADKQLEALHPPAAKRVRNEAEDERWAQSVDGGRPYVVHGCRLERRTRSVG